MILVHRLKGDSLYLNPDLIESVEVMPDTTITLVDGRRTLVRETPAEIVDRVLDFRASVLVRATAMAAEPATVPPPAHLTLLTSEDA